MKSIIFERLKKAGLYHKGNLDINAAAKLPFISLIDLLDEITIDTINPNVVHSKSIHTHCASVDLGGGRDECDGLSCRLKSANELAHFAALYSDQVIITNFLADYSPIWGHTPEEDSEEFRLDVINDLKVLLKLKPLIDAGKILVFTPPATTCHYCYARKLYGTKADLRLKKAVKLVENDLLNNANVELHLDGDEYEVFVSTQEGLFRHSTHVYNISDLPKIHWDSQEKLDRLVNGQNISLNKIEKRDLGFHVRFTEDVLYSLRYQMSVADVIGSTFLTHREIDTNILNFMSHDDKITSKNTIAAKYLQSIVPFAGDVPIDKLLRLREREQDSFILFRSALDSAVKQVQQEKENFTEYNAKSLYSDLIMPELAKLDKKVKEAKRDLIKTPLSFSLGIVAILSFGLYAGMIPDELKVAAASLGLIPAIFNTVKNATDQLDVEKNVRPENYYFLWKVKQLSK